MYIIYYIYNGFTSSSRSRGVFSSVSFDKPKEYSRVRLSQNLCSYS